MAYRLFRVSLQDWKGIFYPPDIPNENGLTFTASKFDTLELNVTFYRFPQLNFCRTGMPTVPML